MKSPIPIYQNPTQTVIWGNSSTLPTPLPILKLNPQKLIKRVRLTFHLQAGQKLVFQIIVERKQTR